MSFGFGIGDFVAVGQLCWKTYKKCKDSPGNFAGLSSDVGALHNVMKETEELLSQQELTTEQKARLTTCQQGCEDVLKDLNGLLVKYQNLGTKSQRVFDRLGFGLQDLNGIRLRLTSNVSMLDAFTNASSQARLENKLNLLIAEIRSGKREGSIISTQTFNAVARNEQETWEALRRDLEDVGISSDVITEKRQYIIAWFQEAIAVGRLEEAAPSDDNDSAMSLYESDDSACTSVGSDIHDRQKPCVMLEPYDIGTSLVKRSLPETNRSTGLDLPTPQQSPGKIKLEKVSDPVEDRDRSFLDAALDGDVALLKKLLDQGVQIGVHFPCCFSGSPALHLAAVNGREEAVRFLLSKGANVNASDMELKTALHQAASKGYEDIIRLLLESGAQIESRTFLGKTALFYAASAGHLGPVRLLLEKGADLKSKSLSGNTALVQAITKGHVHMTRLLLEAGAYVESKDKWGATALHWAARYDQGTIVRLLLDKGAHADARDPEGNTALSIAKNFHHKAIVRQLQRVKAGH